jgi:hypothetical protein
MVELHLHSTIRLHGLVLNELSARTTLPLPLQLLILLKSEDISQLVRREQRDEISKEGREGSCSCPGAGDR